MTDLQLNALALQLDDERLKMIRLMADVMSALLFSTSYILVTSGVAPAHQFSELRSLFSLFPFLFLFLRLVCTLR